jgi:hypothetical protein
MRLGGVATQEGSDVAAFLVEAPGREPLRDSVFRDQRIKQAARKVAELEGQLAAQQQKASLDEFSTEVFENLDDDHQEALRHRVRCEQALRARLAKTDMTPWARLRRLQQAGEYGLLNRRLQAELRELADEDW